MLAGRKYYVSVSIINIIFDIANPFTSASKNFGSCLFHIYRSTYGIDKGPVGVPEPLGQHGEPLAPGPQPPKTPTPWQAAMPGSPQLSAVWPLPSLLALERGEPSGSELRDKAGCLSPRRCYWEGSLPKLQRLGILWQPWESRSLVWPIPRIF